MFTPKQIKNNRTL